MRIFIILALFTVGTAFAETLVIPIGQKTLSLKLDKGFKWKNTCKDYCYQLWNKNDYLAVQIAKLNVREFHLETVCQSPLKKNPHSIKYCVKDQTAYLFKAGHLITMSHKGKSKSVLSKFLGALK